MLLHHSISTQELEDLHNEVSEFSTYGGWWHILDLKALSLLIKLV